MMHGPVNIRLTDRSLYSRLHIFRVGYELNKYIYICIYIYIYTILIHCLEAFKPRQDNAAIRTTRVPLRSVFRPPFQNVSDNQMITRETDGLYVSNPPTSPLA